MQTTAGRYALMKTPAVSLAIATVVLLVGANQSGGAIPDFKSTVIAQLRFNRQATLRLLDDIEKTGKANEVLAWRAGSGRAPIGWQLMHVAASEDRMANKAFRKRENVSEKWAKQFESRKPAGDAVPTLAEVRGYLLATRAALEAAIAAFDPAKLDEKPAPDARGPFRAMFHVLMWHEPHHQGQAHATFNLYQAQRG